MGREIESRQGRGWYVGFFTKTCFNPELWDLFRCLFTTELIFQILPSGRLTIVCQMICSIYQTSSLTTNLVTTGKNRISKFAPFLTAAEPCSWIGRFYGSTTNWLGSMLSITNIFAEKMQILTQNKAVYEKNKLSRHWL
jgi:hypothetical protein